VSAGGAGGANWVALSSSSGVTKPSHGADIGRFAGGVGRHTPGAGGWVKKMGALRPSWARSRIRLSAARVPNAMPWVFALPSGICASDAA
jgi:hypothetical protein